MGHFVVVAGSTDTTDLILQPEVLFYGKEQHFTLAHSPLHKDSGEPTKKRMPSIGHTEKERNAVDRGEVSLLARTCIRIHPKNTTYRVLPLLE